MYQNYILLALLILLPGLAFIVWRWPLGRHATFSQHVAGKRSSRLYYFLLFAITLPILCIFFWRYFVPTYQLSHVTMLLVAIAALSQIACTLIPETGGKKTATHQTLAGISALCLLPILVIIVFAPTISILEKVACVVCGGAMLVIILSAAIFRNRKLPLLIFQASYFAAFFIAIIFVTYSHI